MDEAQASGRGSVVATLATALVIASLIILVAVSLATLLFARATPAHLHLGIGAFLAAAAAQLLVVGALGSLPGTASSVQDAPIAVLAAVVGTLNVVGDERSVFATIIVATAISTAVTAVSMFLVGRARLGRVARYVPYPVQAAFLAATGWLLLDGGLSVASGHGLDLATFGALDEARVTIALTVTVALAVSLFVAGSRIASPLVLPVLVVGATLAFYAIAATQGADAGQLEAGGWLPAAIPGGVLWSPEILRAMPDADVAAISRHAADLISIPFIALLGLLINYAGIELDRRVDIDSDRELEVTAAANLVGAIAGGAPGWASVSITAVAARTGAATRTTVLAAGAIVVGAVLGGAALFARLPLVASGGLLAFLGVSFLHEYLWKARHTVPPVEFASIIAIMAAVVVGGYATGLVVGLVFATARFLLLSGRDDLISATRSGREIRSRAYRTPDGEAFLRDNGHLIQVIHLDGFLFFGTSTAVSERLRDLVIHRPAGEVPRFIILDLSAVTGVDATAAMGLTRLVQVAEAPGAQVLTAGATATVWSQLAAAGLGADIPDEDRFFTVDDALEHGEDTVLVESGAVHDDVDGLEHLRSLLDAPASFAALRRRMRVVEFAAGEAVIREDDDQHDLYVVRSGRIRVTRHGADEHDRLRVMGPGDILGESAFYTRRRGADATALTDASVWRIRGRSLEALAADDPEHAAAIHRAFARLLVRRLGEVAAAEGGVLR